MISSDSASGLLKDFLIFTIAFVCVLGSILTLINLYTNTPTVYFSQSEQRCVYAIKDGVSVDCSEIRKADRYKTVYVK